MANHFLHAATQHKVVAQSVIPHESWSISVEGVKNHIFGFNSIWDHISGTEVKNYLVEIKKCLVNICI